MGGMARSRVVLGGRVTSSAVSQLGRSVLIKYNVCSLVLLRGVAPRF